MKTKPPITFETFSDPGPYQIGNLTSTEPSCFNGIVRFRKQRITIEEVEEDIEVLHERLRKMWRECKNHHHWNPLQSAAKSVGLTLNMEDAGKEASHG